MWPWWPWASWMAVASCIPLVSCTPLASCAPVGKLCGGGVFRWGLALDGFGADVTVAHRMAGCAPLATSVVAGKLWQLTIRTPLASCVAVNELHTVGELVAVGNLCGS